MTFEEFEELYNYMPVDLAEFAECVVRERQTQDLGADEPDEDLKHKLSLLACYSGELLDAISNLRKTMRELELELG